MTPARRIFLNVVATYGRSLYTMALGLFTSRWALAALGTVDYGLLGLIGGLTGFISFLNSLMAVSTSRFFAFSVGECQTASDRLAGVQQCRDWFSAAFSIHLFMGTVLVIVGYPIGAWAVDSYLTIPIERIEACRWVWRMVCLNCFVSMINVPFAAMYKARQEIAEMTLYSFATATLNAGFIFYSFKNPGDWLARYAIWGSIITISPMIVMCIRALLIFEECRFTRSGFGNISRIVPMFKYSASQFIADFASMVSGQGVAIVINKCLGPSFNATVAISDKLSTHSLSLGASMIGALAPAITNAAGARQYERMRTLSYMSCKFGSLFIMIFAIPLMIEAEEVMRLWLGNVPEGAPMLCAITLLAFVIDRLTSGLSSSIEALGRIALFKSTMGFIGFLPLILTWVFVVMGFGVLSIGIATSLVKVPFGICRLFFARKVAGISVRTWFVDVCIPIILVGIVSFSAGCLPHVFMPVSVVRIVASTVLSELVFIAVLWKFGLSIQERDFIVSRILTKIPLLAK